MPYRANDFRLECIAALDALGKCRALTLNESLALERAIRAVADEGARDEVAAKLKAKRQAKVQPGGWASYPAGGTM